MKEREREREKIRKGFSVSVSVLSLSLSFCLFLPPLSFSSFLFLLYLSRVYVRLRHNNRIRTPNRLHRRPKPNKLTHRRTADTTDVRCTRSRRWCNTLRSRRCGVCNRIGSCERRDADRSVFACEAVNAEKSGALFGLCRG